MLTLTTTLCSPPLALKPSRDTLVVLSRWNSAAVAVMSDGILLRCRTTSKITYSYGIQYYNRDKYTHSNIIINKTLIHVYKHCGIVLLCSHRYHSHSSRQPVARFDVQGGLKTTCHRDVNGSTL